MGLFGIAEIIATSSAEQRATAARTITGLWPTREDFRAHGPPILRGTGARLRARRAARRRRGAGLLRRLHAGEEDLEDPSRFGKGAIEGVAGPEAANNAGAQTSFIPLLTLGIPSNPVMALMIGAMMIHGISPAPQVMTEQPACSGA
jgi:putative tricarboxylic transport membrane protein